MGQMTPDYLDAPPISDALTDYDRGHLVLYLRLLDAERDGADWQEVVQVLFGLNPAHNPVRYKQIHEAHLARAQWMTEHGYRELLRKSPPE